jgi:hypothetical protein
VVNHHTEHRDDVKDPHQSHRVTHMVCWAGPVVVGAGRYGV